MSLHPQDDLDATARVIDRLLRILPSHDYNAVDHALLWLREHDHPGLFLTIATRDLMDARLP